MRIALVHDWLTGMRGGEKCLEACCRLWPDAQLYTLIHRRGFLSPAIERMDIRTSLLQHVPGVFENYRYFLPLMPMAIESFRLSGYDVVVSLSHCVAKSVRVPAGVPHVCYCFTPMRYAWQMQQAYLGRGSRVEDRESRIANKAAADVRGDHRASNVDSRFSIVDSLSSVLDPRFSILGLLRSWDRATSRRVTHFIAISRTVQQRIRDCYGRRSQVICPPVDVEFYTPAAVPREDFYLCVSALVPYKRIDLAIRACHQFGRRLVVIGSGPEESRWRAIAQPGVQFLGWQPDEVIRDHYRRCRALLFPGEEDFGIIPLEAQACGTPVIAFAAGGATETVISATANHAGTGVFFARQSVESLADTLRLVESGRVQFDPCRARANAERFCARQFENRMVEFIRKVTRQVRPGLVTDPLPRVAA